MKFLKQTKLSLFAERRELATVRKWLGNLAAWIILLDELKEEGGAEVWANPSWYCDLVAAT